MSRVEWLIRPVKGCTICDSEYGHTLDCPNVFTIRYPDAYGVIKKGRARVKAWRIPDEPFQGWGGL